MNIIFKLIIIFLFLENAAARESGETEITTEDGIEVYQNEKYYILKKNVKIISDKFILNADNIKVNFDKSLYDIDSLEAKGNIFFKSNESKIQSSGEILNLRVQSEDIRIEGIKSKLLTEEMEMYSDGFIEVNNSSGVFNIKGPNSKLVNNDIIIKAENINGILTNNLNAKEITFLNIFDKNLSFVKNGENEMYAKKINFDSKNSKIELIDNVTIIRNGEKISGDYGTLDTKNNSYKIKSNDKTKVKVIIQNNE